MNALATIPASDRIVALSDNMPPADALPVPVERPSLIQLARQTYKNLSRWLADHPVVGTHDEALEAGAWVESVKRSLDELDDERRGRVDPLNKQVREINDEYRPVRVAFTNDDGRGLLDEIKRRLGAYMQAEEERRRAEAEALRLAALEAERLAREAEAREFDAIAACDVGECDIDIGEVKAVADEAFAEFQAVDRMAARAERQTTVRIGSRFGGRATTLRAKETLTVTDAAAAIEAIGLTEKISDAIISAAREYRKLNGALPAGIASDTERRL